MALAAGLLLLIAFPFFFIGGPDIYSTPFFRALWDCGHIFFFAGLVFALRRQLPHSRARATAILTLWVLVVGGGIEIIQASIGRDGNWQDLLRDLSGAWLGLFWLKKPNRLVWCARILVLLLVFPSFFKVYVTAQNQRYAEKIFPLIADFEIDRNLHGIQGNIELNSKFFSQGQHSLKVHLTTEHYAEVSFSDFFNSWQGYRELAMDIYNPDIQPLRLTIRVDDRLHYLSDFNYSDRFNQRLHLVPGWNSIKIPVADIENAPATRKLRLDAIQSMIIFAVKLPEARDIYLDNIRLQ